MRKSLFTAVLPLAMVLSLGTISPSVAGASQDQDSPSLRTAAIQDDMKQIIQHSLTANQAGQDLLYAQIEAAHWAYMEAVVAATRTPAELKALTPAGFFQDRLSLVLNERSISSSDQERLLELYSEWTSITLAGRDGRKLSRGTGNGTSEGASDNTGDSGSDITTGGRNR